MMWEPVQINPQIRRQILESGTTSMLVRVGFLAGATVAAHTHHQEQLSYVASGSVNFELNGTVRKLSVGESVLVPAGVPHGLTTDEDAVLLDIFSPPRADLLASDRRVD